MEGNKSCSAIIYKKNIFGLAFYTDNKFILSPDTFDSSSCDIIKDLIYKMNISSCLFSIDLELEQYDNISETGVEMQIVERSTYSFYKKKNLLKNILGDEFSLSLLALNALLNHLEKNLDYFEFDEIEAVNYQKIKQTQKDKILNLIAQTKFYNIYVLKSQNFLYLNYNTIKSLCLIREIKHPNKAIKTKKENISLFEKINHTQTFMGSKLLKLWILFPFKESSQIKTRRNLINFFINSNLTNKITPLLKRIKEYNEEDFLKKEKKRYFKNLNEFLESSTSLIQIFSECNNDLKFKYDLQVFNEIKNEIKEKIDFSDSEFLINKGIFKYLDEIKEVYFHLPEYLNSVANKVANECNQTLSVIYYPQLGYLIELKEPKEEWELKYVDKKYYYKNEFMYELDKELGDVQNQIQDIEIEISSTIKEKINFYFKEISTLKDYVSFIDCINSYAITVKKYQLVEPIVIEDRKMEIHKVRDILYESVYVHNDIFIEQSVILTGPNGSGKSTILRNIGIAVVLNQMGLFLPCYKAKLCIFDRIYTKIANIESIIHKRSAFLSDIIQISEIFRFATEDSLVLLDEVGKGTNILDGVSLYLSIISNLNYLLFISTTHYQNFIDSSKFKCDFYCMNLEDGIITYKLRKGICEESYGLEMLEKYKFKNEFIEDCFSIKRELMNEDDPKDIKKEEWAIDTINEYLMDIHNKS